MTTELSSKRLADARAILEEVANDQSCKWCRSHIILVARAVKDLEEMAKLSEEAAKNPNILKTYRFLGEKAEDLHVLAIVSRVARLFHRLKNVLSG